MHVDSLAQTVTLTTFALFLSSGFTTISGAPVFDDHSDMLIKDLTDPCRQSSVTAKRSPVRHSVYRAFKRVHTQLKIAKNHFREELKKVEKNFENVDENLKSQYTMSWLPHGQLKWYYDEVWCLDKDKKAEVALPRLHKALQTFTVTFHHLARFRPEFHLNTDYKLRRNAMINATYDEILRVLCEVETAIFNLGIQVPSIENLIIETKTPSWIDRGDFTQMTVQDTGIFKMYRIFLNDWAIALRNATAKGSGACDPAHPKPPLSEIRKQKKSHGKNRKIGIKGTGGRKQGQGKRTSLVGKISNRGTGRGGKGTRRKLTGNK